jgi:hypothetical protein
MFQAEITQRIATQHIADLQSQARQARLATQVRGPRRGFRTLLHVRPRPRTVAARPAC